MGYIEDVKRAASGRGLEIASALGIEERYLQVKKDGPCPFCTMPGEKKSNRFTIYDTSGKMTWSCRKCDNGKKFIGDIFDMAEKARRMPKGKGINIVGDILGIKRSKNDRDFPQQQVLSDKKTLAQIWEECAEVTAESPAGKYLLKRGLKIPQSSEIGAHPCVEFAEKIEVTADDGTIKEVWNPNPRKVPAIVFQITTPEGKPDGLEIVYLTPEGDKVDSPSAKKLHKFNSKFEHGVAIKFDEATTDLVVGEGPELSLYLREVLKLPTWSTANAGWMRGLVVPETVERLYIFADYDSSGTGQEAAWDLAEFYHKKIKEVRVLLPPTVDEGWDDYRKLTKAELTKPLFKPEDRHPEVIELGLPPVPPFEYVFLPECAQEQTARIAENLYAPVDYVGMSVLVALGFLIGTRCAVRPKVLDEWFPVPNFYGAMVGDASTLKTPVLLSVLAPIFKFEVAAREKWEKEMLDHKVAMASHKSRVEGLQATLKAKNITDDDKRRQQARLDEAIKEEPKPPVLKRYAVNSVTTPKLIAMLNQNPRGLLSWHDELTDPLIRWEDQRNISDKTFMLKCWSGTARHTDDTKSGGDNFADPACLSFFGGIQTDKIQKYLLNVLRKGSDGLMARLQLMTFPDDLTGYEYRDTGENKEEKHRLYKVMEFIDTCDFVQLGAVEHPKRPYFGFSVDAQEEFKHWFTDLIRNRVPAERKGLMRQHLSKYRSLMPTLALVIHIADQADAWLQDREATDGQVRFRKLPITKMAVQKAIMLCTYLEAHARRVYSLSGGDHQAAAMVLAEKILDRKIAGEFTYSNVREKGWSELQDKEMIEAALDRLVGARWLIKTEHEGRGRPSIRYKVNPRVYLREKNEDE